MTTTLTTPTAPTTSSQRRHQLARSDYTFFLGSSVPNGSVDLVLTDPPYEISRDSGMNTHYNAIHEDSKRDASEKTLTRTEAEWATYIAQHPDVEGNATQRSNYMQYGTIYGKKYCVKTQYGEWDRGTDDTQGFLDNLAKQLYAKLRKGGTCIIFYDLWKISYLKQALEKAKFKQFRFIEWVKTNPQPLNSSRNYLTNCREIGVLAVKGGSPTFHSQYDDAIYKFPLQGGRFRLHPTQKSIPLFEALIEKHSNEGDIVLDCFLGGGTTAHACLLTRRTCWGCEMDKDYFHKMKTLIQSEYDTVAHPIQWLQQEPVTQTSTAMTATDTGGQADTLSSSCTSSV